MDDPLIPPDAPQEAPAPPNRKLPFSTLLVLTEDQERDMVDKAIKRIDDLKAASGWTADREHPDPKTWFGIREIAQKKYDGKLEFRAVPNRDGTESIFQSSNVTLNTVKHQVRDLVASVVNNTVGTKPFFTTMPIGDLPDDPDPASPDASAPGSSPQTALTGPVAPASGTMPAAPPPGPSPVKLSKLVGMFADDKIDASNCEESLRQGLQTTCIKGEQVYKIAHQFEQSHTRGQDTVLCDAKGNMLRTATGDVIYQDDEDKDAALGAPRIPKDPNFQVPDGAVFMPKSFDRMNTTYRGPDVSCVDYKSWLCPLNVDDIHKGTNVFMYDLPTAEVARLWRHPDFIRANGNRPPTSAEALAMLADLETETSAPKTPVSKPDEDHGERDGTKNDEDRRVMQIAEFYDCLDVDGDGYAEEFILVLDLKNRRALYYNYLDQVFPSGRRPFEVTTLGRVANRWYGSGLFEQYERQELFIDTQLNRENYRNSAAGRIEGYNPEACDEWASGGVPSFGTGIQHKMRPGKKMAEEFTFVQVPELTDGIKELRQEMVQSVQVEGGNIGAADGATSGLNSSKTAYGIRNIEQNKDSLQGFYEDEMQKGVLDVVRAAVDCVFYHMDDVEEFSYTEKDKAIFRTITREQVRGLKYKVSLSLLQKNTQQNLQNVQMAVTLGKDYLAQAKPFQKAMRSLYIQQGKILKIQEAETIFPDPDTLPDPPPPATPLDQVASLMTAIAAMAKAGIQIQPNDVVAIITMAGLPAPEGPVTVTPPQPGDGQMPRLPSIPPVAPAPDIAPAPPAAPPTPELTNAPS